MFEITIHVNSHANNSLKRSSNRKYGINLKDLDGNEKSHRIKGLMDFNLRGTLNFSIMHK